MILTLLLLGVVTAFGPSSILTHRSNTRLPLYATTVSSNKKANPIDTYIRSPIDNYMNSLPWNARRKEEREKRGLRRELASMYRFMGVSHDCDFEELQEATDKLVFAAGNDIKRKIIIEKMKDDILQIRLNERVKGISTVNSEALSATSTEERGAVESITKKKKKKEENTKIQKPWLERVIVRGDDAWKKEQFMAFGKVAAFNALFVPLANTLGQVFLFSNAMNALKFRGIATIDYQKRQMSSYMRPMLETHDQSHYRTAELMAVLFFFFGKGIAIAAIPAPIRKNFWGARLTYIVEAAIIGVLCYPFKLYNGGK